MIGPALTILSEWGNFGTVEVSKVGKSEETV